MKADADGCDQPFGPAESGAKALYFPGTFLNT